MDFSWLTYSELSDINKMAGKADRESETSDKLEKQISCIKYSLFCFNVIAWVMNSFFIGNLFN